jgi:hypothetical protein
MFLPWTHSDFSPFTWTPRGHAVAKLVEALCFKLEGRTFVLDEVIGVSQYNYSSSSTMVLGFTHPQIEMSSRNVPGEQNVAGA